MAMEVFFKVHQTQAVIGSNSVQIPQSKTDVNDAAALDEIGKELKKEVHAAFSTG